MSDKFPSNVMHLYKHKMILKKHRYLEKYTCDTVKSLSGMRVDIHELPNIAKKVYDSYADKLILASGTDSDEEFVLNILILNEERLVRLIESVLREIIQDTKAILPKKRCRGCFGLKKQSEYSKKQWNGKDKKGPKCITCFEPK